MDVIRLTDLEYEYALLNAQADLIRRDPAILQNQGNSYYPSVLLNHSHYPTEFLLPPETIVLRLASSNRLRAVSISTLLSAFSNESLRMSVEESPRRRRKRLGAGDEGGRFSLSEVDCGDEGCRGDGREGLVDIEVDDDSGDVD